MFAHNHSRESLDFATIGTLVADSLTATGYHVMPMECQEWSVQYSLDSENIDGSAAVFFGPALHRTPDEVEVPYLIVGKETRRGEVHLPQSADEPAVASALLNRFHETIMELFQTPHTHDPHVGVGLLPVDRGDVTRE